jgi:DNA mismatch repair protein MutS
MINLYHEYFFYQDKYYKIYGKFTIVLMQVGGFFEAYQTLTQGYDLQILSNMLNIIMTKPDKSITNIDIKNPRMIGFPLNALEKYIKILIENCYTVILLEQVTPSPKPKREITHIYSPSTYINELIKPDSNYLLTIMIEETKYKNNKIYIGGLSLIEPSTGYIKLHETISNVNDEKISLDEIVKFINSFMPTEIILVTSNISNINEIILYLELNNKKFIHKKLEEIKKLKGYSNFQSISYQTDFLKKIYNINKSPIEALNIERYTIGRDAFILSLLYLSDYNSNLLTKIAKPEIYIKEDRMHLGNNPINQLDVFTKEDNTFYSIDNTYKCLFDIINKTSTPMGRRYLKNLLIEPLIDSEKIKLSYDIIEILQKTNNKYESILSEIKDTERLDRKINLKTIHPMEFSKWYTYQKKSIELLEQIYEDKLLTKLLNMYDDIKIQNINIKLKEMVKYIESMYKMEELEKYIINDIKRNIFIENKYPEIDEIEKSINTCTNFINLLAKYFNDIISEKNNSIKILSNERDGFYLSLSNKRALLLEQTITKDIQIDNIVIKISSIKFIKSATNNSNTKIICDEIKNSSNKIIEYEDKIKMIIKDKYIEELTKIINEYENNIQKVTRIIGKFDFLLSGAKIANKYYYNKPKINDKYNNKSYFIAEKLRHPIVERINLDTEYIPTDIELGTEKQDGILLFGLNSAGKSTLQKSIGLNIMMAQIGYYVAASNFEYYPYKSIFTRISSNDNLFKGLSAFTLELTEITAILKRNSNNTLIIADEICKGTEHMSSIIIVMTIIKMLSESQTSFITATHLHEICELKELSDIKNVNKYHLHVECDENNNKLVYDRTLKPGSGSSFYGLLVAKYLINDNKFTEYTIKISSEVMSSNSYTSEKKSKYNSRLYIQKCYICNKIPKNGEIPLETHHINFQKDCDENGYINEKKYLHKNHMSNLVVLCSKCHDKIDNNQIKINGYKETTKGKELEYYRKKNNLDEIHIKNEDLNIQIKKLLNKLLI